MFCGCNEEVRRRFASRIPRQEFDGLVAGSREALGTCRRGWPLWRTAARIEDGVREGKERQESGRVDDGRKEEEQASSERKRETVSVHRRPHTTGACS